MSEKPASGGTVKDGITLVKTHCQEGAKEEKKTTHGLIFTVLLKADLDLAHFPFFGG